MEKTAVGSRLQFLRLQSLQSMHLMVRNPPEVEGCSLTGKVCQFLKKLHLMILMSYQSNCPNQDPRGIPNMKSKAPLLETPVQSVESDRNAVISPGPTARPRDAGKRFLTIFGPTPTTAMALLCSWYSDAEPWAKKMLQLSYATEGDQSIGFWSYVGASNMLQILRSWKVFGFIFSLFCSLHISKWRTFSWPRLGLLICRRET